MLLSYEEFNALVTKWYAGPKTERMGQYLLNNTPYPISDSEIFYGENTDATAARYHDRYVVASTEFVRNWAEEKDEEGVPKVRMKDIKAMISGVEFTVSGENGTGYLVTCTLTTYFGFQVTGKSGTIHHERYNEYVGKRFAFERAFTNLVDHHSYLERYLIHHGMNFQELNSAISEYRKNR